MKKKIDWDNPEKGLLNSINAFYQTITGIVGLGASGTSKMYLTC